jgi:hypothetical protein
MHMFHRIQDNERFVDSIIGSDESTFHVSGNCRIWGSENPHVSLERVRDSPKVILFCALSKERVYGPFFLETTVTGITYLDTLQQFLIPQFDEDDQEGCIASSKTAQPLVTLDRFASTSTTRFPGRWIGRTAPIAWTSRSPDLTPGFVRVRIP